MVSSTKINKGIVFVFLSTLGFGSYGLWSKFMGTSFGVFYQGWTRGLLISLILIPLLLWKKQIIPIEKRDWKWLIIFMIFTSATQAPIYYAFTHMDIGAASLLFFVTILITMYIIGFTVFRERLTKLKLVSFVLALIGLCTIFSFSLQKFTLLAASMAIVNGIASGGEVAFSKKLSGSYSPLYVSLFSWLIIIPTNGLLSLILGEKQLLPVLNFHWLALFCYVFVSLFAFWFVISGLKYVEASIGGLIGLLEVVFSICFGVLIFGENLTVKIGVGAMLILLAASLPHIGSLLKKNR